MPADTPKRVAVVTDSAADLPAELVEMYQIQVVPLTLIMGEKTWRDGVDITPSAFYELLKTSPDFPKTSQPNESTFEELFRNLGQEAEGIVAILVSGELSGTCASAQAAKEHLPELPLEIIDSQGVSMMEGYLVLEAARAAQQGKNLQEVAAAARSLIGKTHVYFIVDTFDYLYRGGRIGAAARFLGSAFDIKPVLEIKDGVAKPAGQFRTRRKALRKVIDLLAEQIPEGAKVHISVVQVAALEEAQQLKEELAERFHPADITLSDVSPVLGAHVGPGTVGVAYYVE
jgi:DegV family protein with EDD domain